MDPQEESRILTDLSKNGRNLRKYKEQTENMIWTAIRQDGRAIEHAISPTIEMCIAAVSQNGLALDITRAAIMNNPLAFQYAHIQSKDLCVLAITKDPTTIRFVINQTDYLCNLAINLSPDSIVNIRNPTHAMKLNAVKRRGILIKHFNDYDLWVEACIQNPRILNELKTNEELLLNISKKSLLSNYGRRDIYENSNRTHGLSVILLIKMNYIF